MSSSSVSEKFMRNLHKEIGETEVRLTQLRTAYELLEKVAVKPAPKANKVTSTTRKAVNKGLVSSATKTGMILSVVGRVPETPASISKATKLPTSTVSSLLTQLKDRKFVFRTNVGWVRSEQCRKRPDGAYFLDADK